VDACSPRGKDTRLESPPIVYCSPSSHYQTSASTRSSRSSTRDWINTDGRWRGWSAPESTRTQSKFDAAWRGVRQIVTDRTLYAIQNEAKAKKIGLWADPNPVPPWERRHSGEPAALLPETADAPAGGSCKIKGNINSRGERIYHVPGQKYYAQTQINESSGERWFCTEAEARAAGWRPSKI
jgi:hypothetical protein